MYNQFTCSTDNVITGQSENCKVQIGAPEKIFLTDPDFQFDTKDNAIDIAKWQEAIIAQDVLPLPLVEEFTDNSEDDTYYTSPITQIATFIREGKTDLTFMFAFDPCLYKRLRGLNGSKKRMIFVDASNNIVGTSPNDTVFKGVISGTLRVQKWTHSTGDNLSFIALKFVNGSNLERNDQVAAYNVDWNIKGLNGIQPALISLVSSSATEIIVDIAGACDGVQLEGLDEATNYMFLKDSDGSEQTISTVTESSTIPGRYTLTGTAFETGTLSLNGVVTVGTAYYKSNELAIAIT